MRRLLILLLLLPACEVEIPDPPTVRPMVPANLAVLTLARGSDEITPVVFPHAEHAVRVHAENPKSCGLCHHPASWRKHPQWGPEERTASDPPLRCRECHNPDESEVEEGDPPDL